MLFELIAITSPVISTMALFMMRRFVESVDSLQKRVEELAGSAARTSALLEVLMGERKK